MLGKDFLSGLTGQDYDDDSVLETHECTFRNLQVSGICHDFYYYYINSFFTFIIFLRVLIDIIFFLK